MHSRYFCVFFFLITPRPPRSTLFPYTTLFRSLLEGAHQEAPIRGGGDGLEHRARPGSVRNLALLEDRPRRVQLRFRSEEHTSELQSLTNLVCRLLLEKKKKDNKHSNNHSHKKT